MPESHSIHIPIPCHEDWSRMSAAERGRHCAVCDKVVRDFVGMDQKAIVEEIAAATTQVCGRFDRSHIAPPALEGVAIMRLPAERMRLFVMAFVLTFGIEVWGVSNVDAQTVQPAVTSLKTPQNLRAALSAETKDIVLKGTVVDVYTREPVAYAQLKAYDKQQFLASSTSDTLGNFTLRIAKEAFAGKHYQLKLRYMGRERVNHEIDRDTQDFLYLIDASNMLKGIAIETPQNDWWNDPQSIVGYSIVGAKDVKLLKTRAIYSTATFGPNTLYRPLDEWLMMHSSEIHHNGRW